MLISVNKLVNGVMYINLSVSTGIPCHGKISGVEDEFYDPVNNL